MSSLLKKSQQKAALSPEAGISWGSWFCSCCLWMCRELGSAPQCVVDHFLTLEVPLQYTIHLGKWLFIKGFRCWHCKALTFYYWDSEGSGGIYQPDHGFQPDICLHRDLFCCFSEIHSGIGPVSSAPDTQMPKLQKPAAFLISVGCLLSANSSWVWKITLWRLCFI